MFLLSDWKDRAGGSDTRFVGCIYLILRSVPPKSQRLNVLDVYASSVMLNISETGRRKEHPTRVFFYTWLPNVAKQDGNL